MDNVFYSWRQVVLNSKLQSTTKHVLLTLGCHMNDMGESCFPSIAMLARETSLSDRAVITHLEKAETAGFIKKSKHGYAGQKWKRNEYKATFPLVDNFEKVVNDVQCLNEKVVNVTTEGGERSDKKVVNDVHTSNPSIYPISIQSENPSEFIKPVDNFNQQLTSESSLLSRLIDLDVNISSQSQELKHWIENGVAYNLIFDCVGIARQYKPAPEKIPAKYLHSVIQSQLKLQSKPSNVVNGNFSQQQKPWFLSNERIEQKAKLHGLDMDVAFPYIKQAVFKLEGITNEVYKAANAKWNGGVSHE